MYEVSFEKRAKKQFYNLSRQIQERIVKAINEKLTANPHLHLIPLRGDMTGLYKFRVGDYRLLCAKKDEKLCILVVKVKHRKEVYRR